MWLEVSGVVGRSGPALLGKSHSVAGPSPLQEDPLAFCIVTTRLLQRSFPFRSPELPLPASLFAPLSPGLLAEHFLCLRVEKRCLSMHVLAPDPPPVTSDGHLRSHWLCPSPLLAHLEAPASPWLYLGFAVLLSDNKYIFHLCFSSWHRAPKTLGFP